MAEGGGMSGKIAIAGPFALAVAVLVIAGGAGYAAMATIPLDRLAMRAEVQIIEPRPAPVVAGSAPIERIVTAVGQHVTAGDVVADVDTTALDREIAALQEKSASVQRQLDAVRAEAQSIGILHGHGLVPRSRLTDLETQLAALETSAQDLVRLTNSAEQRLAGTNLKAPMSGIVTMIALPVEGRQFRPGDMLLQIAADADRVYLEGRLPHEMITPLAAHGRATIDAGPLAALSGSPIEVRLISTEAAETAEGGGLRLVRLEALLPRSAIASGHLLEPGAKVMLTVRGSGAGLPQVATILRRNLRLTASSGVAGD